MLMVVFSLLSSISPSIKQTPSIPPSGNQKRASPPRPESSPVGMWMILTQRKKVTMGRSMMQKGLGFRSGIAMRKCMKQFQMAWGLSAGGGYVHVSYNPLPALILICLPSSDECILVSNLGISCLRLPCHYGIVHL